MSTIERPTARSDAMRRPLTALGALWLTLAAAITIAQLLQPMPITVEWRTETEVNAAGYNIYRSPSPDGPYIQINEQLIASKGSSSAGASYVFVDDSIRPGQTYYYRLEDVELDSSTMQHAPIEYAAPRFPWWMSLIVAVSVVIGLFLIVRGIRSEKIIAERAM